MYNHDMGIDQIGLNAGGIAYMGGCGRGCGCGCHSCGCHSCGCGCGHHGVNSIPTFTLEGTVINAAGVAAAGIEILYTVDGFTFSTAADAFGHYVLVVPPCESVTIAPAPLLGVIVSPPQYVLTGICSDVADLDFTLTPLVYETFTISGRVDGLPSGEGISVIYTLNGISGRTETGPGGMYAFEVPANTNVTVTPTDVAGYTVAPPYYVISSINGDVAGQDFVYIPV